MSNVYYDYYLCIVQFMQVKSVCTVSCACVFASSNLIRNFTCSHVSQTCNLSHEGIHGIPTAENDVRFCRTVWFQRRRVCRAGRMYRVSAAVGKVIS